MVFYVVSLFTIVSILGQAAGPGNTCLERNGIRDADGQVGEHGEKLVCLDTAKGKVVRDLMDSQEKIVVRCAANSISR